MLRYNVATLARVFAPISKKPIRVARAAIKLKISGQAMGRIVKLSYWPSGYYNK